MGGATTFYHQDALGSVAATTNASQQQTTDVRYTAFGTEQTYNGSLNTFGWNGKSQYQKDRESGLMLLGHRYYDQSTGRFLSEDPGRDGTNWYAYCGNNPLGAVDPSGMTIYYDRQPPNGMQDGDNKPVQTSIYSDAGRMKMESIVADALKTEMGAKLLEKFDGPNATNDLYLVDFGGVGLENNYANGDAAIAINLNANKRTAIWVDDKAKGLHQEGPTNFRIFAHELGHTTGTGDTDSNGNNTVDGRWTGGDRMLNVIKHENVMVQQRIKHRADRVMYGLAPGY